MELLWRFFTFAKKSSIPSPSNSSTSILIDNIQEIPKSDLLIQQKIGEGSYGSVYKALWISRNQLVAVKKIRIPTSTAMTPEYEAKIHHEIKNLSFNRHENIVNLFGFSYDTAKKKYLIIQEFIDGKDLNVFLDENRPCLQDNAKWFIFKQIVGAVNHLHLNGFIHRDLKSSNFMIENQTLKTKLLDFGTVKKKVEGGDESDQKKRLKKQKMKSFVGTQCFWAPEILESEKNSNYTTKTDIFALSFVFYELFSIEIGYQDDLNVFQMNTAIAKGERPKIAPKTNKIFKKIISECWEHDPNKRIDTETLMKYCMDFDKCFGSYTSLYYPNNNRTVLDAKIERLEKKMDSKIEKVDQKIDDKMEVLERKLNEQFKLIVETEKKKNSTFLVIFDKIREIETKTEKFEKDFAKIEKYINQNHEALTWIFRKREKEENEKLEMETILQTPELNEFFYHFLEKLNTFVLVAKVSASEQFSASKTRFNEAIDTAKATVDMAQGLFTSDFPELVFGFSPFGGAIAPAIINIGSKLVKYGVIRFLDAANERHNQKILANQKKKSEKIPSLLAFSAFVEKLGRMIALSFRNQIQKMNLGIPRKTAKLLSLKFFSKYECPSIQKFADLVIEKIIFILINSQKFEDINNPLSFKIYSGNEEKLCFGLLDLMITTKFSKDNIQISTKKDFLTPFTFGEIFRCPWININAKIYSSPNFMKIKKKGFGCIPIYTRFGFEHEIKLYQLQNSDITPQIEPKPPKRLPPLPQSRAVVSAVAGLEKKQQPSNSEIERRKIDNSSKNSEIERRKIDNSSKKELLLGGGIKNKQMKNTQFQTPQFIHRPKKIHSNSDPQKKKEEIVSFPNLNK